MDIFDLAVRAGEINAANGWHDRWEQLSEASDLAGLRFHILADLMRVTEETSEAADCIRKDEVLYRRYIGSYEVYPVTDGSGADWTTDKDGRTAPGDSRVISWTGVVPRPEGLEAELADVMISVLDLCYRLKVDLGPLISEKLDYNSTRGRMHGNKVA